MGFIRSCNLAIVFYIHFMLCSSFPQYTHLFSKKKKKKKERKKNTNLIIFQYKGEPLWRNILQSLNYIREIIFSLPIIKLTFYMVQHFKCNISLCTGTLSFLTGTLYRLVFFFFPVNILLMNIFSWIFSHD